MIVYTSALLTIVYMQSKFLTITISKQPITAFNHLIYKAASITTLIQLMNYPLWLIRRDL